MCQVENILLTRSSWKGDEPRTTTDDTTRARPPGGAEESRQEADHSKQAAQLIGLSERQLRRLLAKLRGQGDQPVIHAARGRCSNRKISAQVEKQAVAILSQPEYAGLGPGCGNPAGGSCGVKGLRVVPGLRGGKVRLESRLDGNLAARFGQHDLALQRCLTQPRSEDAKKQAAAAPAEQAARPAPRRQGSGWMDNFDLKKGPSLWLAARASGARRS